MRKIIYENPSTGETLTFADDSGYGLTSLTGTGIPDVENTEQRAPSQDGTTWIETLLEPREIKAEFICYNATPATAYETMRYVNRVLNCKTEPGKITYTNDYGTWVIYGTPDVKFKEYKVSENSGRPVGKVTFYCYDPYWQDADDTVIALSNLSDTQEVTITGDVPSPITAVITGSSTGPVLTEAVQSVKLDYNATSSKMLTITTGYGNKRVLEQNESLWSIREQGSGVKDIIVVDDVYWGTLITGSGGSTALSVCYSIDGSEWVVSYSVRKQFVRSSNVVNDGTYFYIVVNGQLGKSTDGKTFVFNPAIASSYYPNKIKYINGNLIVEYGGTCYKSTDQGTTWTAIFSEIASTNRSLLDIILIGTTYYLSFLYNGLYQEIRTSGSLVSSTQKAVATTTLGSSKFAIIGSTILAGTLLSNDAGVNFTEKTQWINSLATDGKYFIGGRTSGNTVYSLDGDSWTNLITTGYVQDVCYNSIIQRFALSGTKGQQWISDGISVTQTKTGISFETGNSNFIKKIKFVNDLFFLFFNTPYCLYTADFITFTYVSFTGNPLSVNDVCYFGTDYFFATDMGIHKTSNLTSSTVIMPNTGTATTIFKAIETDGTTIITSRRNFDTTTTTYYTSTDGVNFTDIKSFTDGYDILSVFISNGVYGFVGSNFIETTDDFTNWNLQTTTGGYLTSSVLKTTGKVYVVETGDVHIYISSDNGLNWTTKNMSFLFESFDVNQDGIFSLVFDGTYFYIVINEFETKNGITNNTSYVYRAKQDMLYWERYDIGDIPPLLGMFYEDSTYGVYGYHLTIIAINRDNTPVNKIQNLTTDSKFFSLKPGKNILKLDVDTGLAIARVSYRNRYTGVGC